MCLMLLDLKFLRNYVAVRNVQSNNPENIAHLRLELNPYVFVDLYNSSIVSLLYAADRRM